MRRARETRLRWRVLIRISPLFVLLLAAAGCAGNVGNGYLLLLESGSVVATDKTVSDHVVSRITGRDCSTVRVERGESYCVESVPAVPPPPPVYCEETLGGVDCYTHPDAYKQGRQPVGTPLETNARAR